MAIEDVVADAEYLVMDRVWYKVGFGDREVWNDGVLELGAFNMVYDKIVMGVDRQLAAVTRTILNHMREGA